MIDQINEAYIEGALKVAQARIEQLEAENQRYRMALKMYANDKHLDCTIALRVLENKDD